jgi:subtilase family serine protease
MAPNAKIYLVEAASDSTSDLFNAVKTAAALPGVKEVSMSWGGSESASEVSWLDAYFVSYGIVYLAAGGDTSDEVDYPSASPNVVSCGGTSLNRSATGAFISETGWSDTGCGLSAYEGRPAYQSSISTIVGPHRGVNDLSFDADPNTGVYVYDSTPLWGGAGWWILGGTSLATPCLAGVLNEAAASGNGFALTTASEQVRIYGNLGNARVFRDITSGTDGTDKCGVGWDLVTGVGSPVGLSGK